MKKNNKYVLIFILSILSISLIIFGIYKDKILLWNTDKGISGNIYNNTTAEVNDFNEIINWDIAKLDIKSCDWLKGLKDLCISQIKDKLRPENKFTDTRQCEKVTPKEWEPIEKTHDICILNVANKIAKDKKDTKLCTGIKESNLKSLCEIQISNKFIK